MNAQHTSANKARRLPLIPAILLVTGGIAYGSLFTANKIAIEAGFPFISYTFWQALVAGIALFAYGLVRSDLPRLTFRHLRQYVLTSTLGLVFPVLVLTFIAGKLPAGVVTLIIALAPPLTYVFAFLLRLEKFRWPSILGVVFGFAGILLIVLPEESLPSPDMAIWIVVALLVPLSLATNNMQMTLLRPPQTTTTSLVCGILLGGAVVTFPIMLVWDGFHGFWEVEPAGIWTMLWAGAIQLFTFFAILETIRLAGPVFLSQINYIIVIAGFLWALALFNEGLSGWVWAALGIMLIGLTFANIGTAWAQRESPSAAPPVS